MHSLNEFNRTFGFRAVEMQAQVIRRVVRDAVHEVVNPRLALCVACAAGAYEFLAFVLSQRQHLCAPDLGGVLGADACAFGLVEEEDDFFVGGLDSLPVITGELGLEVDHGSERGAALELGWNPGVPIAHGGDWTFEIYGVHGPGDTFMAWSIGVGPVCVADG